MKAMAITTRVRTIPPKKLQPSKPRAAGAGGTGASVEVEVEVEVVVEVSVVVEVTVEVDVVESVEVVVSGEDVVEVDSVVVDDEVVEVVVELSSGPRPEPAGVMVVKSSSPASFCSVTDSEVAGVGPSDELIGVAEGSGVVPDPVGEVGVVGSLEVTSGWVVGGVLGWTSSWLSDPGLGRARRGAAQRPKTRRTGMRNVRFILIWRSGKEKVRNVYVAFGGVLRLPRLVLEGGGWLASDKL